MTHIVQVYSSLYGAPYAPLKAKLLATVGVSMSANPSQNNGTWLIPGSTSQYENVPAGQWGDNYFLNGDKVYARVMYDTTSGKITQCVIFAKADNFIESIRDQSWLGIKAFENMKAFITVQDQVINYSTLGASSVTDATIGVAKNDNAQSEATLKGASIASGELVLS